MAASNSTFASTMPSGGWGMWRWPVVMLRRSAPYWPKMMASLRAASPRAPASSKIVSTGRPEMMAIWTPASAKVSSASAEAATMRASCGLRTMWAKVPSKSKASNVSLGWAATASAKAAPTLVWARQVWLLIPPPCHVQGRSARGEDITPPPPFRVTIARLGASVEAEPRRTRAKT